MNKILTSDNPKQFYNYVNRKLHVRNPIPSLKLIDNPYLLLVSDKDKAEYLSTQYHSVFNVNTNNNLPKFPTNINSSIGMFPINKEIVRKFLISIPNKFNRASDNIPKALLKAFYFELYFELYHLYFLIY